MLGIQEDADIQIRDSLVYSDNLGGFNSYLDKAMDQQPVLKLISLKKDAAHQKYNVKGQNFYRKPVFLVNMKCTRNICRV